MPIAPLRSKGAAGGGAADVALRPGGAEQAGLLYPMLLAAVARLQRDRLVPATRAFRIKRSPGFDAHLPDCRIRYAF